MLGLVLVLVLGSGLRSGFEVQDLGFGMRRFGEDSRVLGWG